MARTPIDKCHELYSRLAHKIAEKKIYPPFFPTATKLNFVDTGMSGRHPNRNLLDGDLKIDYFVHVCSDINCSKSHDRPKHFFRTDSQRYSFQERWREPSYRSYQDLTLTRRNQISDVVSELHKINTDFMLYGYCLNPKPRLPNGRYDINGDFDPKDILQAIIINVANLKKQFIDGNIKMADDKGNEKSQLFSAFSFRDLISKGIAVWQYVDGKTEFFDYTPDYTPDPPPPSTILPTQTLAPIGNNGKDPVMQVILKSLKGRIKTERS